MRSVNQKAVLSAALSVIFTSAANAQDDPCSCNSALLDGVFSFRSSRGDNTASSHVRSYVQQTKFDQYKKDMSAGLDAKWKGFGFGADMTQGQFESHQSKLVTENDARSSSTNSETLLERFGDQNVLNAWSSCKLNCNRTGFRSGFTVLDKTNARLQLTYIPPLIGPIPTVKVESSAVVNGRVEDGSTPAGKLLMDGELFHFGVTRILPISRLDPSKPIIVSAKLITGDVYEYIPVHKTTLQAPSLTACEETDGRALFVACDNGKIDDVRKLLGVKPQCLNYQDRLGQSCIYTAALACNEPLIKLLLTQPADVNLSFASGDYQASKDFPLGRYAGWSPLSALRYNYVVALQPPTPNVERAEACKRLEPLLLQRGAIDSAVYRQTIPIGKISNQ